MNRTTAGFGVHGGTVLVDGRVAPRCKSSVFVGHPEEAALRLPSQLDVALVPLVVSKPAEPELSRPAVAAWVGPSDTAGAEGGRLLVAAVVAAAPFEGDLGGLVVALRETGVLPPAMPADLAAHSVSRHVRGGHLADQLAVAGVTVTFTQTVPTPQPVVTVTTKGSEGA